MDDIFARIAEAQATQNGNWIRDGKYLLCVKDCKYEELTGGLTWVTEFIVVASVQMPGMYHVGGEPCAPGTPNCVQVEPNLPGEKVTFVAQMKKKNGPGNVKAWMLALTNRTEAQFNAEEAAAKQAGQSSPFAASCKFIISPQQPLRGALIRAATTRKVNQGRDNPANRGKLLVMPTWEHVPNDPKDVATRRALIEQGLPIPTPESIRLAAA